MQFEDNKVSLHHNYLDIGFKFIADNYYFDLFNIFNLSFGNNSTLEQVSSELTTISSYHGLPDKVYLLNNKILVILEFDSTGKKTVLPRFMVYAAQLSEKYYSLSGDKVFYPVQFYVVYPATVPVPPSVYAAEGNLLFSVNPISLGVVLDSDAIFAKVSQKFASSPNYIPSPRDSLLLALSPQGRVEGDRKAFCRNVANLTGKLFNTPEQGKFLGLSAAFINKYLKVSEFSSLLGLEGIEMSELADLFSNGKYSSQKTEIDKLKTEAAEFKAENAELKAAKEAAELKAAELKAAKDAAELRTKIITMVLKLSRSMTNSADIAHHTGLPIEEIEQILN